MLKINSIRQRLELWLIGTILAIVVIAVAGVYNNILFSTTQKELTEKVIPISVLGSEVSHLAAVLATREKQLLVSNLLEVPTGKATSQEFEQQLDVHWKSLNISLDDELIKQAAAKLQKNYQQFLKVDDQLLKRIAEHQDSMAVKQQRVAYIEKAQQQAQAVFATVSKQQKSRQQTTASNGASLIPAFTALELDMLRLNNLVLKIGKQKQTNASLTETVTTIKQVTRRLTNEMAKLKTIPNISSETLATLAKLARSVQAIKIAAIESDTSLYQLRYQQMVDEKALIQAQQESIESLNHLVDGLNELASLINERSLEGINSSIAVAEKTRWLLIVLTIVVVLAMIKLISSISRRVNKPLAEVRKGMHALTTSEFETRLNGGHYDDEFKLLAKDFNKFAATTQTLIHD